jgi:ribosome-binding factor A
MSTRRTAKVAEAIRGVVSMTVLFGLKDPRVRNVTVLRVEVSPDLRSAKVYVSVMGDEKQQSLTMHGLNSARGFIQSKIAERLDLRYTPILQFVLDQGVKVSVQTSAVIREAMQRTGESAPADEQTNDVAEGDSPADSPAFDADSVADSEVDDDDDDGAPDGA